MNAKPDCDREPFHLFLLRSVVYAGAALLFVYPLAGPAGMIAAVTAVPLGLLLGERLAASRLRLPLLGLAALAVLWLGFSASWLLGGPAWVASVLGVRATLTLIEVMTFGLIPLGALAGLRALSIRVPALALLETAAVAAVVVLLFAGHRDSQISQPRFLSDWALSRGQDPLVLLLGVGVVTLGALALLLLQKQRLLKTATTLGVFLLLGVPGCLFLQHAGPTPRTPAAQPGGGSKSGKPNPMDLTSADDPKSRKEPVAVVIFHDDYTPVEGAFYFRQMVLSSFNGQQLVKAKLPGADLDAPAGLPKAPTKVTLPAARLGTTRPVPTTVALILHDPDPIVLLSGVEMEPRDNPNPKMFVLAYGVTSRVQTVPYGALLKASAGDPAWSEELRKLYLAYPGDPRYAKLVEEIVATLQPRQRDLPMLRVLATKRWLEKNIIYSLKPPKLQDPDPTTGVLFGERKGKCTHVAHAMCYLLRAQGIPARVAAGYCVPVQRRGQGSSVLIQKGDGHAWCEVYVQDVGWVVFDPALEQSEEEPDQEPDPQLQQQLAEQARRSADRPENRADGAGAGFAWAWLLLALPALLIGLYLVKAWRRLAPRFARAASLYRVCYRAVLDRLAELGLWRQFGETREEFAQRLARLAPDFEDLSAAHVRRALAERESFDRERWLELQRRVVEAVAARFPLYRKVLGLLNPVAWLWAR